MTADKQKDDQNVLDFWNARADLGPWAGTRDVVAKALEVELIASYVNDGMRIVDVGCGNGITAIEIARRHEVSILGIDYAQQMIEAARRLAESQTLKGEVHFQVGRIPGLSGLTGFDLAYTERMLINLPDWETQQIAIREIGGMLRQGGRYVMCENSRDGLEAVNGLRRQIGLKGIDPPWHNRYLQDDEIAVADVAPLTLEHVQYFSSTYYLLSRVVNAWLAAQNGDEPDYDAPINRLALQLPAIGNIGQGRAWIWRSM